MNTYPHVLILAAGQGKRMHSRLPKVLHPLIFRPMLHYVLDLAHAIPHKTIGVIVGFGADQVKAQTTEFKEPQWIVQAEQLGTGHAVLCSEPLFSSDEEGDLLVLSGDVPLLTRSTIQKLLDVHRTSLASCTMIASRLSNPEGYGRILRDKNNQVVGIREEADCNPEEKKISDVNSGIYLFKIGHLFPVLRRLKNKNAQGEYYLTDAISLLLSESKKVESIHCDDPLETLGINDRYALWRVETLLQRSITRDLMVRGVSLRDPNTVFIDPRCRIGEDITIEGNCYIINSTIESGVTIEASCRISNTHIGKDALIRQGSYIEGSTVGPRCNIGPYARLRAGTSLEEGVKIGNFVETKKATFEKQAKASHLSYVGDARIGARVNLGCGFITCNYDGKTKHETVIEDDVFVGSDSQTVAPVRIGAGSYVASGTTITEDVPPDSLVISRGRQVTKAGYSRKPRSK